MHSGSIEGSPKAGPHTCNSNTISECVEQRCVGVIQVHFPHYKFGASGTLARDTASLTNIPATCSLSLLHLPRQLSENFLDVSRGMAPLRRYLRITKHSVLEVRIYLDRPADADAWLLKRDNPALPRVIQAVRPLVLPKLREENERGKGKGGARTKKKGVKDVVVEG